jgi:hypothetical protein
MEEYFFLAVSNRKNLNLCMQWLTAGFPDTINGAWAFCDIKEGDFVTFLYGAKAYNLYRVTRKFAVRDPASVPPKWEPLIFKQSGRKCYFPFRLQLKPVREFEESLTKEKYAYIAENLLQRGGYWKTHFQADQTTLSQVSQINEPVTREEVPREVGVMEIFEPKFARVRKRENEVYPLREVIVQAILRHHLLDRERLKEFLNQVGVSEEEELEVLGEKALPQGYVDILIKRARPRGENRMVAIEVKLSRATDKDAKQLEGYMDELGSECVAGILMAEGFSRRLKRRGRLHFARYTFDLDLSKPHTFQELLRALKVDFKE